MRAPVRGPTQLRLQKLPTPEGLTPEQLADHETGMRQWEYGSADFTGNCVRLFQYMQRLPDESLLTSASGERSGAVYELHVAAVDPSQAVLYLRELICGLYNPSDNGGMLPKLLPSIHLCYGSIRDVVHPDKRAHFKRLTLGLLGPQGEKDFEARVAVANATRRTARSNDRKAFLAVNRS